MAVIFSADGIITGSNGLHTLTNERKTKIAIFSYPSTSIIFFFSNFLKGMEMEYHILMF